VAPDFVPVVNIRNTGLHAGCTWSTLGHLRSNGRSHLGVNKLFGAWAFNVDFHIFMCFPLWCEFSAHDSGDRSSAEHPRFAAGAKRGSRSHDIIPYIDQIFSLMLMSKNLDELLPPLLQADVTLLLGKE